MDIQGCLDYYGGLSPLTKKCYRCTLSMLERYIPGDEPTDDDVLTFLRSFKKGSTLQRHKAAVKAYYDYKKRPWSFDRRQFARFHKRLPEYISREEVDRLIAAGEDKHEQMFVKTLFITGLRIGELMSLDSDSLVDGGIKFIGKGGKERMVPIVDREFYQELAFYVASCPGKPFPLLYSGYWLILRKMCARAGVRVITPHKLRHSRAVDLMERGASVSTVQAFLGHSNPATTLIYTELKKGDLTKQLKELEK